MDTRIGSGNGESKAGASAQRVTRSAAGDTTRNDTQSTTLRVTRRRYKPRARMCACGCGVRFTPTPRHPKQRFASDACRQRAYRARKPKTGRGAHRVDWYTCVCCRERFIGIAGKGRKYCTPLCKRTAATTRREEAVEVLATSLNLTLEAARDMVDVHGLVAARQAARVLMAS